MLWLTFWTMLVLGFSGLTRFLHIPNCVDQCSGGARDPSLGGIEWISHFGSKNG
jgi:hypothetical protein